VTNVRQSLLLSLADSYLGLVLQVASTVVIARLLTPSEVGTFAVAAVLSTLASALRDFGVAEYLIQERQLSHEKIRAALAVNISVSWSMAMLMFGGAPMVGAFYGQPGIVSVMQVMAFSFVLVPFGAVTQAWFRRELQYTPIVICNASSSVVNFVVAITLALSGFSYMSLAWASLAGVAAAVAVSLLQRPEGFPRWPSFKGAGAALRFGGFASLIYIFGQLGKGAPELIIGRASGMADVGLFSRAGSLVEMFNRLLMRPVLHICMPYLAKADRERNAMSEAYALSVGHVTAVGWPFLGFLAVCAYAVIRLIYGAQWLESVPVAQVLCMACAVELLFFLSKEALLAAGDARRANELTVSLVALQVMGLLLVIPYGLIGAAFGVLLAAVAGSLVAQFYLHRVIGLRWSSLLARCRGSLSVTAITVAPVAAWAYWSPPSESNFVLFCVGGGALTAVVWLAALRLTAHSLWSEVTSLGAGLMRRLVRT
jgi:O-antigen/teichoic acid export membrane protein